MKTTKTYDDYVKEIKISAIVFGVIALFQFLSFLLLREPQFLIEFLWFGILALWLHLKRSVWAAVLLAFSSIAVVLLISMSISSNILLSIAMLLLSVNSVRVTIKLRQLNSTF